MSEIWKEIEGVDYSISNKGNVRNDITGRVFAGRKAGNGYLKVTFHKDRAIHSTEYVHRLVAEAFIPKSIGTIEVNHIDGNKANNRVGNLEWVTSSGNTEHAVDTEALIPWGNKRKPIIATDIASGKQMFFKSISKAERYFDTKHINAVLSGKRKSAKGQHFAYAQGGDA